MIKPTKKAYVVCKRIEDWEQETEVWLVFDNQKAADDCVKAITRKETEDCSGVTAWVDIKYLHSEY